MLDFKKLRYFCAMVEEGGIHKAARRLGLTQPPLSLALREMEDELGCMLVFRSGRNWIVTEAGRCLYEEGRRILAQMENLPLSVRSFSAEIRGEVRAGISTSCVPLFERVLPRLAREFPGIACHVMFTDSARLQKYVRERVIDFGVLYLPVSTEDLVLTPLPAQWLVAVFSRLLPPPPADGITLEELCEYPLLLPRRWGGGGMYNLFAKVIQNKGLTPRVLCATQATYLLRRLLKQVAAVALMPRMEADAEQEFPKRTVTGLDFKLQPALATLKNTYVPLAARQVMSLILAESGLKQTAAAKGDRTCPH